MYYFDLINTKFIKNEINRRNEDINRNLLSIYKLYSK